MFPAVLFFIFAAVLIAAALGVILARNPVYSALLLVLCFFNSAVIWLLLDAEFLGIVLVLVYVGAVMVLFLFVIMMLDINLEELRSGFVRYAWFGWIMAVVVGVEVAGVVLTRKLGVDVTRGAAPLPANYSNTFALGEALYTRYTYALEIAAMVLLVAMVAAITLTLRHRVGLKAQDINKQVAARASER